MAMTTLVVIRPSSETIWNGNDKIVITKMTITMIMLIMNVMITSIMMITMMTMTTFVVTLPSSETIGSIKAIFSRMTSRKPYKMLIKIKFIKKYPSLQSASRM